MKYLLNVANVTKTYHTGLRQTTTVLTDCRLQIRAGEVVSLIGINGAGKTTLLKIIVGITAATNGKVTINGRDSRLPAARRTLGYMPENPQFYSDISAETLLLHIAGLFHREKTAARREMARLLELVELTTAARQPIRTFSKGMRQRLGFAQALIGQPTIVLLDEPLDGLDPLGRRTLKQHILSLKKDGVTVILCSHILSDIAEISDRVGVLHAGTLHEPEPPKTFIGTAPSLEEAFVQFVSTKVQTQ